MRWTNENPLPPLTYHTARVMFARADQVLATGHCTSCGVRRPIGWPGIALV